MSGKTLYGTLGISTSASQETIRAAWERLSSQWDPARPVNSDAEARRQHAAIQSAYFTLGNAQRRAAYDRKLKTVRRVPAKKTRWMVHAIALALTGVIAATYADVAKIDIARVATSVKKTAIQLVQRKPAAPTAETNIAIAQESERNPSPQIVHVEFESRDHADSLKLKLETELASRQPLARVPLSQL